MKKPGGWQTFADNPVQILSIALTARDAGIRASALAKIKNELAALEFDMACTYRLLRYENERERDRFKTLGIMLGGGGETEENSVQPVSDDEQIW